MEKNYGKYISLLIVFIIFSVGGWQIYELLEKRRNIEASKWDEGKAYLTIEFHQLGNFEPYVFKTENFLIRKNFFINIFNQCMPITFALFLVAVGSYILLSFISIFGDSAIAGYGAAIRFCLL